MNVAVLRSKYLYICFKILVSQPRKHRIQETHLAFCSLFGLKKKSSNIDHGIKRNNVREILANPKRSVTYSWSLIFSM